MSLTLVALSTLTVTTGCYTSGGTQHSTALAPIRSDDQGYRYAAGRTGSGIESRSETQTSTQEGATFEVPLYEETLRVGTREVDAGGVRIRKQVQTETVNQPVQLRRETLAVDRLPPGDASQAAGQAQLSQSGNLSTPFQEDEMVIRLKREEPVVEKQVVEKGRIVARKKSETQQQTVQREVRREDIDVTPLGNSENVIISQSLRSESTGGTGSATGQATATADSSGMITEWSALQSTEPSAVSGKQVRITGNVQQIQGERALVVSGNGGSQIMVRSAQPISTIKQGDRVQITGTISEMSEDTASALGLSQDQLQQIQNQRVFIEAQSITPQQQ